MIQLVLQWIEFAELWLAYFWRQQRQEPFFTLVIHCQHNRSCYNCMYYYAVLQNFWILVNHKAEVLITYVCSWRTYLQWLRSHQKILFKLCRVVPVWLAFVDITDKSTFERLIITKQNLLQLWTRCGVQWSPAQGAVLPFALPAAVYRRSFQCSYLQVLLGCGSCWYGWPIPCCTEPHSNFMILEWRAGSSSDCNMPSTTGNLDLS